MVWSERGLWFWWVEEGRSEPGSLWVKRLMCAFVWANTPSVSVCVCVCVLTLVV